MELDTAVSAQVTYSDVRAAADRSGLVVMGAQHPRHSGAKQLDGGTLILLGAAQTFWPVLKASPEWADGQADPVDRWSLRVVGAMAGALGATPYYPFSGPPYTPFIDWALKSGRTFQSPVGALVHDAVGMMISFRGALHFADEFPIPAAEGPSPCATCHAPCTSACPVGALSTHSFYDVNTCHAHLTTPEGQTCMAGGCLARLACPLSAGAGRLAEQSAHHMKAFHPS